MTLGFHPNVLHYPLVIATMYVYAYIHAFIVYVDNLLIFKFDIFVGRKC